MKTYLEPDEVSQMENAATNLRDKLLVRVLFHLGCRVSEALGMAVNDIDFGQATLTIKHLKKRLKLSCSACRARLGVAYIFCPKCGSKISRSQIEEQEHRRQRILPIDSHTLNLLNEYIERDSPVVRDGKRLIFGINRHRAWQIIKACAEEVGLPKLVNPETGRAHSVSPDRLRDAFAIMAVKQNDSGDGLRLLQEHLGHQSFDTTARYRKISGVEHREWYQKLWNKKD